MFFFPFYKKCDNRKEISLFYISISLKWNEILEEKKNYEPNIKFSLKPFRRATANNQLPFKI